jgi:HK97 family phage portal protein
MRNPFRRQAAEPETRVISELPWSAGALSSQAVTVERALSLVPVYSAARLIASSVASLPMHAYRQAEGFRESVELPPLFAKPGVSGNRYAWKFRAVTSLALRGNAVGLILQRDRDMYPSMVEWLNPSDVTVQDGSMSGPGSFANPIWFWHGRILNPQDVIHIPWFPIPGKVWGLSPISACAMAISSGLSAQEYTRDWFDNGAVPPGKFKNTEKTIDKVESEEIRDRLVNSIRRRKPLVYGADWDYDPITVSQHEARFVETLKLSATQIANIYGIPPEMIGGETGGSLTYNNPEQQGINFITFVLRPWLELIEDAFFDLMPKPRYVKFNVDAMLRVDITTRHNVYKTGREIGLYSIDECRALEDRPPLPNGEGATHDPLGTPKVPKPPPATKDTVVPEPVPGAAPGPKAPPVPATGRPLPPPPPTNGKVPAAAVK